MRFTLHSIRYASFVKLWVNLAGCLGFVVGLALLATSLLGDGAEPWFFGLEIRGPVAGIAAVALAPLSFSMTGVIAGAITFLPFRWWLKRRRGIVLFLELEDETPTRVDSR